MQGQISKALNSAKLDSARRDECDIDAQISSEAVAKVLALVDQADAATEALSLEVGDPDWWQIQIDTQSTRVTRQVANRAQETADKAHRLLTEARGRLDAQVRAASQLDFD